MDKTEGLLSYVELHEKGRTHIGHSEQQVFMLALVLNFIFKSVSGGVIGYGLSWNSADLALIPHRVCQQNMGLETPKQAVVCSLQELLQERGVGFEEQLLEKFSDKVDSCYPWFREEKNLDKRTWERVGEALKNTQADNFTLCLWVLIKDAIEKEISQMSDSTKTELEESQEECLSERTFSERGPLNPKLERYRDSDDELTLDKEDHSERGAAKYFDEDWPPRKPPPPLLASTLGDATHMDTQLSKLEFEIKWQKLTNELRELKRGQIQGRTTPLKCTNLP